MITKEKMYESCANWQVDLETIVEKLMKLHPEWETADFAMNLIEFGRGQISGVGKHSDNDINFYRRYLGALDMENIPYAIAVAYFAGCTMGLVQRKILSPEDFVTALEFTKEYVDEYISPKDLPKED